MRSKTMHTPACTSPRYPGSNSFGGRLEPREGDEVADIPGAVGGAHQEHAGRPGDHERHAARTEQHVALDEPVPACQLPELVRHLLLRGSQPPAALQCPAETGDGAVRQLARPGLGPRRWIPPPDCRELVAARPRPVSRPRRAALRACAAAGSPRPRWRVPGCRCAAARRCNEPWPAAEPGRPRRLRRRRNTATSIRPATTSDAPATRSTFDRSRRPGDLGGGDQHATPYLRRHLRCAHQGSEAVAGHGRRRRTGGYGCRSGRVPRARPYRGARPDRGRSGRFVEADAELLRSCCRAPAASRRERGFTWHWRGASRRRAARPVRGWRSTSRRAAGSS